MGDMRTPTGAATSRRAGQNAGPVKGRDFLTAFARGLTVMNAFTEQSQSLTLADVARIAALPRATARRCLLTLRALGYVEHDDRYFSLSPQVLTIAQAYLSSSPLPRLAQPFLERINDAIGESCSVAVLQKDQVIHVARSSRKRLAEVQRGVGAHLPAFCTSLGRVLLAALPQEALKDYFKDAGLSPITPYTVHKEPEIRRILSKVREDGYCYSDQEFEIDVRAIAVPLYNASGRLVAALNVSTQASRTTKKHMLANYLPLLRHAAAEMRSLLIH
jgi:IclR family transcriptional regulator, pca regulon regulatory protein